jgi:hypothetical protein
MPIDLNQKIQEFGDNADRVDQWVNDPVGYTDKNGNPVDSIPKLIDELNVSVQATVAGQARDEAVVQAGVATAQAEISIDQAEISTAQAGIATTQAAVATAARIATEGARDAAIAGANIFDDTVDGLAGTVSGDYFQIPSATATGYVDLYLNNAGVADYVDTLPNLSAVADLLPISTVTAIRKIYERAGASSGTSNVVLSDSNTYTGTGTCRIIEQIRYSQDALAERTAGRDITIQVDIASGGFSASNPTIKQYNASSVQVGATLPMTVSGGVASVTFTIDPAAVFYRFDGASTTGFVCSRPYEIFQGQTLIDDTNAENYQILKTRWADLVAKNHSNIASEFYGLSSVSGGTTIVGGDSKMFTVPAGAIADFNLACEGVLFASDEYTIVLEKLAGTAPEPGRDIFGTPDHLDGSGSGETSNCRSVVGNLFFIGGLAAAAGGRDPAVIRVRVDNRSPAVAGFFTASDQTFRVVGLFVGRVDLWRLLDVEELEAAYRRRAAIPATVGAPSAYANSYSSIANALRAGHRQIAICADQRHTLPLDIGVDFELYGLRTFGSAANSTRKRIYGSTQLVPGSFTATAADANVLYYAMSYNPLDIWEYSSTGVDTRMGEAESNVTIGKVKMSASEADVRAGTGRYWYGAGSEGTGLYIRPFNDTTVSKTWEIPNQYVDSIIVKRSGKAKLSTLDLRHSLGNTTRHLYATLITEMCEVGRSAGTGNSVSIADGGTWFDDGSRIVDGGNDNVNYDSNANAIVRISLTNTEMDNPQCDNFAGHFAFADVRMAGCIKMTNAGKQNFVTISSIKLLADTIIATGARDVDFLHSEGAGGTVESEYRVGNLIAGSVTFSNPPNPASVTGQIQGRWASLSKADSAISAFLLNGTLS